MVRESNQLNFNLPKRVLLFLTKNIEDTRGVSRRVRHGHELEVSVVVSTLYSLITNLVHRGFAMGINGDAILMTFVRLSKSFFFGGEEGNADFNDNTRVSLMGPPPPPPALKPNFKPII